MSNVQTFLQRQIENRSWGSYDSVICRLYNKTAGCFDKYRYHPSGQPVFACKFAHQRQNENVLALSDEDGQLFVCNTEVKEESLQVTAHNNAVFDLAWMFNRMKLVTVSGDHTARLFDVGSDSLREERVYSKHTRSVKTVAFNPQNTSVFASGARDGVIILWDTRMRTNSNIVYQCDISIHNPHYVRTTPSSGSKRKRVPLSAANSITGLVFQDDLTLISCGAGDGVIKVWDLRKTYTVKVHEPTPKYVLPYVGNTERKGFTDLVVDYNSPKLYVNCLDNVIYCYNIATYNQTPIMKYIGHENASYFIKSALSKDGRYLVSGSSDQNAYVWNTERSTPLVLLGGHSGEVTCVTWCQNTANLKLVTCSDDTEYRIWRVGNKCSDSFEPVDPRSPSPISAKVISPRKKEQLMQKHYLEVTDDCEYSPKGRRKRIKVCEECLAITPGTSSSCSSCNSAKFSFKLKRSSPSNAENENKRLRTDRGARCLFGVGTSTADKNREHLATILEENHTGTEFPYSLTANLPNFVVDGTAPHFSNYSPEKRQNTKDWLTNLRIQKRLMTNIQELASPSPPKRPCPEERSRPKQGSAKKVRESGDSKAQSTLLGFVRVEGKK